MNTCPSSFPIDSAAILFLAQMAPDHTNVYRFAATMAEPVSPDLLQQAVHRVHPRFPTLFAGFLPGPRAYRVVPASHAPQVRPDPGLMLTMTPEEIRSCAYRVFYRDRQIIIELFHALADGFGAITSLRALLGEYLYLLRGISSPERESLLEEAPDWEEEIQDAYPKHCGSAMGALPQRYSYRLPGADPSGGMYGSMLQVSTQSLRQAAKRYGVSVTTLLTGLMAESIGSLQHTAGGAQRRPVRIMVPADLRRKFSGRTLRNFSLYALPTLEPEEMTLPLSRKLELLQKQLLQQTETEFLRAQITRNVKLQQSLPFRCLPLSWKRSLMLFSNRLFGETNSSITLTNLGPIALSDGMLEQVEKVEVYLTPRRHSPYNCGLISCGDQTCITITRFGTQTQLEELFFEKIRQAVSQ